MHTVPETSDLITRLLDGETDAHFVDSVIDHAVSMARRYIQWLVWQRGYSLGPTGLSIDDLAYDLIAELVSELDGEVLGRLKGALRGIRDEEGESFDVECAFIAVVNRTARLNLARFFMEVNPLQSRLLRSLRRYADVSPAIIRIDSVGGYWYAAAGCDPQLHLPAVPADALRSALAATTLDGHPVRSVLHAALDAIACIPGMRQAVCEHDILEWTHSMLQSRHIVESSEAAVTEDVHDSLFTERALHAVLSETREWVDEKYVQRGKLSIQEAEAMFRAILLYVDDLKRDDVLGHFTYLRQVMPGLTQRRYRESYRNTYEYIVRTVFTNVRRRLE